MLLVKTTSEWIFSCIKHLQFSRNNFHLSFSLVMFRRNIYCVPTSQSHSNSKKKKKIESGVILEELSVWHERQTQIQITKLSQDKANYANTFPLENFTTQTIAISTFFLIYRIIKSYCRLR